VDHVRDVSAEFIYKEPLPAVGAPLAIALSRTVSRRLPQRPHLDIPKREARELLNAWRVAESRTGTLTMILVGK